MPPVNKVKCIRPVAFGGRVNRVPLNYYFILYRIVSLLLKKKDYTWNTEFVNITSIYYNNNNSNKLRSSSIIDEEHSTKQRMWKKRKRKLKS